MTKDEITDFYEKIENIESNYLKTSWTSLTRKEFDSAESIIGKVLSGACSLEFYFNVIKNKDDILELIEDLYGEEIGNIF